MALCAIFAACCAQLRALLRPSGARPYGRTERAPYPPQRGLRQLRLVQRPVDLMHGPAGEGLALRRCARGAALQQRIVKLGRRPVGRLGEDCSGISIHTSGKPHDSYRVSLPPRTSVVLSTRATGAIENDVGRYLSRSGGHGVSRLGSADQQVQPIREASPKVS